MLSLLTSLLHGAGAPVYIVGYLEGNTKDATLWITDISASSPKPVILENQIGDSGAYSLTAINNQLFCLVVQTDNQQTIPTLCITDTSGSSPQPVQLTAFTPSYSAGAITSVNNKIFCSGSSLQYATAALLIFDSLNQSQSIITLGTENYTSFGNAVIHENNKIYCGGYQTESSDQYATLWITNPSGENLKTVQLDKGPESTV